MKKTIILICCLFAPLAAQAQQTYREYMEAADKAFISGAHEKALELLRQTENLAVADGEKAAVKNAIGWVHHSSGSSEEAKKYLAESLAEAVKAGDAELARKASNNLGLVELSQGNIENAAQQFSSRWSQGSVTANIYLDSIQQRQRQRQANAFIASGISHRMNGDFEKAIAEYDQALQIAPDNVKAMEHKGYALYRLENYSSAVEILEKAYALEKEGINVLVNLLKVHCASGAADALKKVIEANRDILKANEEALQNDGELRKVCGKLEAL